MMADNFHAWIVHWKEKEKREPQFLLQLYKLDEQSSHHSYPNVNIMLIKLININYALA